jgi:hypothetical protein
MTSTVQQARRLLILIAIVLIVIDIAAGVTLLSPLGRGRRDEEFERLRIERQQKEAETRPTRDMDKKIVNSREAIAGFYKNRLPQTYAEISETLGKTAAEHHVVLSQVKYDAKPAGVGGLHSVTIGVSVSGDYASQMNFINALERETKFYVVENVAIGDSGSDSNQLRVDVQLQTFLRNAA